MNRKTSAISGTNILVQWTEIAMNASFIKQRSPHHTQEKHTSDFVTQPSNYVKEITHALSEMNDREAQLNSVNSLGNWRTRKLIMASNGEKWRNRNNIQTLTKTVMCVYGKKFNICKPQMSTLNTTETNWHRTVDIPGNSCWMQCLLNFYLSWNVSLLKGIAVYFQTGIS